MAIISGQMKNNGGGIGTAMQLYNGFSNLSGNSSPIDRRIDKLSMGQDGESNTISQNGGQILNGKMQGSGLSSLLPMILAALA